MKSFLNKAKKKKALKNTEGEHRSIKYRKKRNKKDKHMGERKEKNIEINKNIK